MKELRLYGQIIFYNEDILINENIKDFLINKKIDIFLKNLKEGYIIVLGGDGTMLKAIKQYYKKGISFLGINFGNKGFLLNGLDYFHDNKELKERSYPLLEIKLSNKGIIKKDIAFNEIDIRAGSGKIITLNLNLSSKKYIDITGDGVIISTPAGSTGYNSSLGGPLIPHTFKVFVITPKAPWIPKGQPSMLINDSEKIEITDIGRKVSTEIYCDSRDFFKVSDGFHGKITIKKSKYKIKIVILENYLNIWDNKIYHELGFKIN